jgi:hypothetical protein
MPAGASTATLAGQICISTMETAAVDHDVLQLELLDGSAVISSLGKKTNRDGAKACQFGAFELTAPVTGNARTATLRLRSSLDATMTTSFYLDNLSLTIGCAP